MQSLSEKLILIKAVLGTQSTINMQRVKEVRAEVYIGGGLLKKNLQ